MDKNYLIEGLARAVEMAKPAQEYCLFWIQHWSMCMTKAEWSGWMQAVGAIFSIFISVALALYINRRSEKEIYRRTLEEQEQLVFSAAKVVFATARTMEDARDEFFQNRSDLPSPRRLASSLRSQITLLECLINKQISSEALSPLNYVHGVAAKTAQLMEDLDCDRPRPHDRDDPFIMTDPVQCRRAGGDLVRIRKSLRVEIKKMGGKISLESIWEEEI